jgi:EAL domain-containing protein (putative c-di-GMP-specific phosphodiesterase class I)
MAEIPSPDSLEEKLLLDRLNRMEAGGQGYYAVHLHLSDLKSSNRKPHFVRLAARNFDGLTNQHEATLFQMKNADQILLCRNVPVNEAEVPVEKVRALFSEDPLTHVDDTGLAEDRLSTWYDLSEDDDLRAFIKIAGSLVLEAEETAKREAQEQAAQQKAVGQPLTAQHLTALAQVLPKVPIDDLIREQLCLHIGANGPEGVLFREYFISIGDLKKRIAPGVNLFSSVWLFQYMTETLDRTILANMAGRNFDQLHEPISLNLNIGTVLSRDFQNFHRAAAGHEDKVVIEMQVIDIFSDVDAFTIARNMLQQNGYRVLVDGISPVSMQFFDPAVLEADFIKIGWGKEFVNEEEDDSKVEDLRRIIRDAGKESIILSRVDSEDAIQWGLNLGITRFQGFLMDRLIDAVRSQGRRARIKKERARATERR